ncbi:hypothetical protein B6N13_18195 [Marinomonas sp. UCMA 3892]|uniref:hypothetical protein n=1 Tax=unclassified Marinomonas TaxID=196814 RepID=UPI00146E5654|nr:hypothetical protein [Marinomonas sp. UCMA 3892]NLV00005.1 hypothetical protein [Marinomonas sp. UCMA 3892]
MQQDFPRPQNYPYKDVFYFDGEIALIKGRYKDSESDSIGMRWMVGESELGYPSTFGNAMWMVVPDQLAGFILEGIFSDLVSLRKNIRDFQEFMDALDLIRDRKIISVNSTRTSESQHLRGF